MGKVRTEENALWSFAPHDVSMILALAGRLPEKIVATGANYITQGVADTTLSHLSFSDDLQAHIFVSWLHPYKDHKLVVIGEDGMVVFDDVAEGDNKLLLYSHVVANKDGIPLVARSASQPIAYEGTEPLKLECEHFIDCIVSGRAPVSGGQEGAAVLTVLKSCELSILDGSHVTLPPIKNASGANPVEY